MTLLFPAVLDTELKECPYLCFTHGLIGDKRESFLLAGAETQGSICDFFFSFLFFFPLFSPFFLLMRCTMKGGKANLIIKPVFLPSVFPAWEVQSSPF